MSRKLYLFGDINKTSNENLVKEIYKYNEEDDDKAKRKPIELHINTFGGSTYDCLGLVDVIKSSETPIHTIVNGYAMSAGFLIAAVGHKRFCYQHSTYMYHNSIGGVRGDLKFIEESQEEYKRVVGMYDDILLKSTKLEKERIDEVKDRRENWYMDAKEAKKFDIVDEILN